VENYITIVESTLVLRQPVFQFLKPEASIRW